MKEIEQVYCSCGCGRLIPATTKRGYPAKFARGHYDFNKRKQTGQYGYLSTSHLYVSYQIKCTCGCGQMIPSSTKAGKARRFAHGHNIRGLDPSVRKIRGMKAGQSNKGQARPRGDKSSRWKGGRFITKGRIYIYCPGHTYHNADGYVLEHRLIMEQILGRYLLPTEQVHHINGTKDDNRKENLRLTNVHEHINLHRTDLHNNNGDNHLRALRAWVTRRKNLTRSPHV